MSNNELFEKHVINVMDSYCRYYDNIKKEDATSCYELLS